MKHPQYKRKGKTKAEILAENPDAFKKKSLKESSYLKIGKFKKKNVYDVDVDMSDYNRAYFLDLGKQVITDDQFISIGFNYALIKGLELAKEIAEKNKNKKKK